MSYSTDWLVKVAFMREHGLSSAKWAILIDPATGRAVDTLCEAQLGELPPPPDDDVDETQSSRKKLSAEARALAARAERRRIALGASGRPVRRVSED